jgi:hypothetical protein
MLLVAPVISAVFPSSLAAIRFMLLRRQVNRTV